MTEEGTPSQKAVRSVLYFLSCLQTCHLRALPRFPGSDLNLTTDLESPPFCQNTNSLTKASSERPQVRMDQRAGVGEPFTNAEINTYDWLFYRYIM